MFMFSIFLFNIKYFELFKIVIFLISVIIPDLYHNMLIFIYLTESSFQSSFQPQRTQQGSNVWSNNQNNNNNNNNNGNQDTTEKIM